jgi:aquaporin Z
MPIRIYSGKGGLTQMKASFKKNWIHYLQEALGLAIFMISACFFAAMLEAKDSALHLAIDSAIARTIMMGVLMGTTALFIFYSPWTSPSGSQINPAVTLSFLRMGKMCPWDVLFFILFQIAGGVLAVYVMQLILGGKLVSPPVNSVATVPVAGILPALITEFLIAFITMIMVMFTSHHEKLKNYTRILAGCLVCAWVIVAGPISGFGMNPARSFASALPANIWTAFWIYLFAPIAGMLLATEFFVFMQRSKNDKRQRQEKRSSSRIRTLETSEFVFKK